MTTDPQMVYGVVRDGKIVHVRLNKGMADACANIEKQLYNHENVNVVPMMLTEVAANEETGQYRELLTEKEKAEWKRIAQTPPGLE